MPVLVAGFGGIICSTAVFTDSSLPRPAAWFFIATTSRFILGAIISLLLHPRICWYCIKLHNEEGY
ncbi:MAG: hypothetical protein KC423_22590, partial [Anaerolineales bacterium]|nr:hypothetical protein [Anaerolineales bacterium]